MRAPTRLREALSRWGEKRPLPGLAASAARPIPWPLLLGLVLAFALAGVFGRGPWRGDDIQGIAVASSLIQSLLSLLAGSPLASIDTHSGGWIPSLAGQVVSEEGPLLAWIAALFILPLELASLALTGGRIPIDVFDDLVRLVSASCLVVGLYALWRATDRMARRREARPVDPLGIGPDANAFGRTMGDCAVLLCLACLGSVERWHESGSTSIGFLCQALLLWALAIAPEHPKRAGYMAGSVLAAFLLSDGLESLLAYGLGATLALALAPPLRLVWRVFAAKAGLALLGIVLGWLLMAGMVEGMAALQSWWLGQFRMQWQSPLRSLNEWAWTWWPLWPIALAMLIQAKRHGLLRLPHLVALWAVLAGVLLVNLLGLGQATPSKLLPIAPLAMLCAFGLLSIPRNLTSLLDWFAVVVFTALGVFIWLYWTAMYFQFPPNLVARLDFLAPGLRVERPGLPEILIGVGVSGAWLGLVIWRIRRTGSHLWRPVALSAGGLSLAWILLTTLWLPGIQIIKGYEGSVSGLNAILHRNAEQMKRPIEAACVATPENDTAAKLLVLATTDFSLANNGPYRKSACPFLLRTEPTAQRQLPPNYRLIWIGRRATERRERERYVLFRVEEPMNPDAR